jgi:transposase
MSKGKQIDIGKKVKVMACHREGLAPKEIANRLKRDISTIRKIISATKHLPVSATLPAVKKRSGRLKMNTARQKERFSRYLLCYPLKTAKEIKQEVAGWSNITMRTIQMVCQKSPGLPSRSAAKKPQLTTEMIKKRQNFCKKHCSWTEKSVVFSDTSAFRLINPRAMKVRQPSTTKRYKQRYTEVNVKHLASVMVWGCFSGTGGRGSLYFLPPQDHDEQSPLHQHAGGQAHLLDGASQCRSFPPSQGSLPHQ